MAIRKYFKSTVNTVMNGPGGKDLNFISGKSEIAEENVKEVFDEFFDDAEATNGNEMKEKAWEMLNAGKSITLNGVCYSSKPK